MRLNSRRILFLVVLAFRYVSAGVRKKAPNGRLVAIGSVVAICYAAPDVALLFVFYAVLLSMLYALIIYPIRMSGQTFGDLF